MKKLARPFSSLASFLLHKKQKPKTKDMNEENKQEIDDQKEEAAQSEGTQQDSATEESSSEAENTENADSQEKGGGQLDVPTLCKATLRTSPTHLHR